MDIPVAAGREIAEAYGYDQVVIVARKVGGREHVTTYGVDPDHCGVAARMGSFFKHKLMGWPNPKDQVPQLPLSEFRRMQIIGDEFPLALVQPVVIAKVDSVCLAVERAHGICGA